MTFKYSIETLEGALKHVKEQKFKSTPHLRPAQIEELIEDYQGAINILKNSKILFSNKKLNKIKNLLNN